MKHYAQLGRQTWDILLSFTPLVEPLSLEEAFLDVRGCEGLFGPALEVAVPSELWLGYTSPSPRDS